MKFIKKIVLGVILLFLLINNVEAKEKLKINLFYLQTCPHCHNEIKWLKKIEDRYDITYYEVTKNEDLYYKVVEKLGISSNGVPLTIIGDDYLIGFSDSIKREINSLIKKYENKPYCDVTNLIKNNKDIENCLQINSGLEVNTNIKNIPLLGDVNVKKISLPMIAIIMGFVDGFNPCAMWILIFLITMLMNMKNKKRMWILGLAFLITSALVYMFFMLSWINIAIALLKTWFQYIIAIIAIIAGIVNLNNYFKTKNKESGCTVTNNKKRKRIITKIQNIVGQKKFILAFIGIIILAISVNFLELACSAGLPLVFTQILTINDLSALDYILYVLIYIIFFMLDDIIVFTIAMVTFKLTGISNKYTKYSHLLGGIIMIIIGILMIFKMDWLMFNF